MLASLLLSITMDAEVANGLRNLAQMHHVALGVELTRTSGQDAPSDLPPDVWGTAYRIKDDRITSAGSDRKFDEGEPKGGQFSGTEGDVVFVKGEVFRSNRNWLYARAKTSANAMAALEKLREAELTFMRMRMPLMRNLTLAQMTTKAMVRGGMDHDAWGTPLRVDGTRVISAGADRKFDPESWSREATLDAGEDIIVENGKVARAVDAAAAIREDSGTVMPIAQPVDEWKAVVPDGYRRVDDKVVAPVVKTRVEPVYAEAYRRARIRGIVMLEAAISKEGVVEEVWLLKSLAPDLDAAAMDAARQWTFEPAKVDGKPVAVIFPLAVAFMLH
ncbi:MAG TPA: TonB family protein [Thermoanaerobaculia bacterium]|jgi:TonB family protein|nr:TonB family protein [Thermoanaerobaculia bacterium]